LGESGVASWDKNARMYLYMQIVCACGLPPLYTSLVCAAEDLGSHLLLTIHFLH